MASEQFWTQKGIYEAYFTDSIMIICNGMFQTILPLDISPHYDIINKLNTDKQFYSLKYIY